MNKYFKYVDYPDIPAGMFKDLAEIESGYNVSSTPQFEFYKVFTVSDELNLFLKSIFQFEFVANIHVMRPGFPIHKDRKRKECINYLLSTGGDNTKLSIYDEDKKTEIFSEHIPIKKWHWIDVSKFHGVSGIEYPRYALTISIK